MTKYRRCPDNICRKHEKKVEMIKNMKEGEKFDLAPSSLKAKIWFLLNAQEDEA